MRVLHLRNFGNFLCAIENIPLNFDTEKNTFFGPTPAATQQGDEQQTQQELVSRLVSL